MHRRTFVHGTAASLVTLGLSGLGRGAGSSARQVMTVRGPIEATAMGWTLSHEHLLADFRPYAEQLKNPRPYDPEEVSRVIAPHLERARRLGCQTFVDCTAVGLGRDAALLKRMSEKSGLNILTVTGNYAAMEQRALPPYVVADTEQALAERWINEWKDGIDGTGIRPGLIKLGFNGGSLQAVDQKLIGAAASAHLATGLSIGAHISGPSPARPEAAVRWSATSAFAQLAVLEKVGVDPSAWIWIHAQNERDRTEHVKAARRGAWISFDGLGGGSEGPQVYVELVANLRNNGLLHRALVSQDAGWYWVGEPQGGKIRPYDTVFTEFLPALRASGFSGAEIDQIFIHNPAAAFSIGPRRRRA